MDVARVLLIGEKEEELLAQSIVLGHFWTIQTALSNWSELSLARAVSNSDVVILCDTLDHDRRQGWVDLIREGAPEKVVVQLNSIDTGPRNGLDATVAVEHGPGALVATVYGLLVERGLWSKGWKPLDSTLLDEVGGPIQ